jgi:hypothetical protein
MDNSAGAGNAIQAGQAYAASIGQASRQRQRTCVATRPTPAGLRRALPP